MIAPVSLRLLYLIFLQILGLVLLMSRASSTKDLELLIFCSMKSRCSAAPTRDHAWTGRTVPCSPP